jgi:hypothetical protein
MASAKPFFTVAILAPRLVQNTHGDSEQCSARNRARDAIAARASWFRGHTSDLSVLLMLGTEVDQVCHNVYATPFQSQHFPWTQARVQAKPDEVREMRRSAALASRQE